MEKQHGLLLEELGFDVSLKGALLFDDLIEEVVQLLNSKKSEEELRKALPSIYLENYHFIYEIGKFKYFAMLNEFLNSIKLNDNKKQSSQLKEIFKEKKQLSLDDALIDLAKYINKQKENENENSKVNVKSINSL